MIEALAVERVAVAERTDVGPHRGGDPLVLRGREHPVDEARDLAHVGLDHPAGRERGRPDPDGSADGNQNMKICGWINCHLLRRNKTKRYNPSLAPLVPAPHEPISLT